jgi:hypothetical protein
VSRVPQSTLLGCRGEYRQVSRAPHRECGCLPPLSVGLGAFKTVATRATSLRQYRVTRGRIHLGAAYSPLRRKFFSSFVSPCSPGWRTSGLCSQSLPSGPPGSLSPSSNGCAGESLTAHSGTAVPARPPPVAATSTGPTEVSSLVPIALAPRPAPPGASAGSAPLMQAICAL